MKFNPFILTLVCAVSSIQLHPVDKEKQNYSTNVEGGTNEEKWTWGYAEVPESNRNNQVKQTTISPVTEEANPCLIVVDPTIPDFSAPGRRMSEIKCLEYIWDIKFRQDKVNQERDCKDYKKRHLPTAFFRHFVVGGRDTALGEFPHMGGIGWKATVGTWLFKCGSTLISSKFVLTAAHCSSASTLDTSIADPVPKIVRLGDKNISDKKINSFRKLDVNIIKIIVHPKYKSPKQYFDIALMELENEVVFTQYVHPACLWPSLNISQFGQKAALTGWGVVETSGRKTTSELQAAIVDLIDSEQCDPLLRPSCNRNWCGVQEHQLCAGKLAGGVDACQGDSGGPLQEKIRIPLTTQGTIYHVLGVTSFGIGCALKNLPGIYTRVSSFIDWIENNVWQ